MYELLFFFSCKTIEKGVILKKKNFDVKRNYNRHMTHGVGWR